MDCSKVCDGCKEILKEKCAVLCLVHEKFIEDYDELKDMVNNLNKIVEKLDECEELNDISTDLTEMLEVFQKYIGVFDAHKCNCDFSEDMPAFKYMFF